MAEPGEQREQESPQAPMPDKPKGIGRKIKAAVRRGTAAGTAAVVLDTGAGIAGVGVVAHDAAQRVGIIKDHNMENKELL